MEKRTEQHHQSVIVRKSRIAQNLHWKCKIKQGRVELQENNKNSNRNKNKL